MIPVENVQGLIIFHRLLQAVFSDTDKTIVRSTSLWAWLEIEIA